MSEITENRLVRQRRLLIRVVLIAVAFVQSAAVTGALWAGQAKSRREERASAEVSTFRTANIVYWITKAAGISLVPLLGFAVIRLYDQWGWRYFNRSIDFGGRWRMKVKISPKTDGSAPSSIEQNGEIKIVQSPFGLTISDANVYDAEERHIASWRSRSITLSTTDERTLYLLYELVHRGVNTGYDNVSRYGAEIIIIIESNRRSGRPTMLRSNFYDCVDANSLALHGQVTYERIS